MKETVESLLDNQGFIALIGTLFGGVVLEMIRRWFDRKQKRQDDIVKMREEAQAALRLEINALKEQLTNAINEEHRLEAEIDKWKAQFYDIQQKYTLALADLKIYTERLRTAGGEVPKNTEQE